MDCVSPPAIMTAPEDGSASQHDAGQVDGGRGGDGGFRAGIWDAIEAGGGGVWELDPATGGQTWSPGHLCLHGLDPAAAVPGFGQWLEFVEPRDRPVLREAVAAVSVPDAQPIRFEMSLLPASGRPGRRLSCWVTRSAGGDGSQSRVAGVSLDVTGQEHPAPLLDALGFCPADSLYVKDGCGRAVFANLPLATPDGCGGPSTPAGPCPGALPSQEGLPARKDGRGRRQEVAGCTAIHGQQQFCAIFEQAAAGMGQFRPDGRWIRANGRLCGMLGYSMDELLGMTCQDVTHPQDIAAEQQAVASLLAGRVPACTVEKRYVARDGTVFWGALTLTLARDMDGEPRHIMASVEDISVRKSAENALRESEERFRRLFEGAPLPNWLADPFDGSVLDCNGAAEAMLGYGRNAILRMKFADFTAGPADGIRSAASAVIAGRSAKVETRHRTRSGRVRDVELAVVPVDSGGRRLAHCTVVDVTDRKAAELALTRLTEELEARVGQEVAARDAAQARAAQAERLHALGQLACGVAHDFNNLLQAVSCSANVIERRADEPDAVRRSARVVSEACDRGGSITRRLLTFARRGNLCAQALDPVSVLAGVGDIMAPALDAAITLRIDAAPGLPQMYADHGQLETALVNLAANARDAMPDGGTLTLSASAGLLPEGIAVHGDGNADGAAVPAVCLSVSDTGVGMDGATLSRVFEPFFTTKPRGSGTGLGLPMVKGFAEQSGGGVSVDSLQGRGTTVAIWLPQAPEQEVRTENAAASAARAAGPPLRVLVVDDDPLVLEALAGELGAGGFAVAAATSGAAALELLDGGALFDAIVSDLSMPGMDGVSLISAVQERLPHLAAVLLTGYAADAVVEALERNARGPFAVLRKPLRGREIAARISALLDGQRCAAA